MQHGRDVTAIWTASSIEEARARAQVRYRIDHTSWPT
jgi:hypothetical protein